MSYKNEFVCHWEGNTDVIADRLLVCEFLTCYLEGSIKSAT